MLQEFKKFLMKGNAVDMAVGFIFGAAFGTVVKSLVENVVMPPIGLMMADVDLSDMKYVLQAATDDAEEVAINYGVFINDIIAFVILGFAVFMIVRTINNLQAKEEAKPAPKAADLVVLEEIRDMMKKK